MAVTAGLCNSFKHELLVGGHNFTPTTGDVFKIALFTSAGAQSATTTAYAATNEASNTNTGYTAGGATLTANVVSTTGATAGFAWSTDPAWTTTTGTLVARYALIYNSSKSNKAVMWVDFGADQTASGTGTFTVDLINTIAGSTGVVTL